MSVILHEVNGYQEYNEKIESLKTSNEPLYLWFMGARVDGKSWCGDCRESEPVINDYLNSLKLTEDINVVCVEVERDDFKGPDCKFRSDASVNLEKVPTLINPSLQKRLVERDCLEKDKLDQFFSEVIGA